MSGFMSQIVSPFLTSDMIDLNLTKKKKKHASNVIFVIFTYVTSRYSTIFLEDIAYYSIRSDYPSICLLYVAIPIIHHLLKHFVCACRQSSNFFLSVGTAVFNIIFWSCQTLIAKLITSFLLLLEFLILK